MDRPTAPPPSIDALSRQIADVALPHALLVRAAREALAAGEPDSARQRAELIARRQLQPVINATGVLLHTNLGRAPLAHRQAARYTNLELDLDSGRRGSRAAHAGPLLAELCGAPAALILNNGAGAILLALAALAVGRRAIISRGELVEIGGGFRIPDVLALSGAQLVEVGTTNRTRRVDYEAALAEGGDAVIVKVHQSNYKMVGFTESVGIAELSKLGVPVIADVGSGLLDANTPWLHSAPPRWLAGEPGVRQALEAGATLATFSGDKLLGGPQAGVVVGQVQAVQSCARHPLARALRPGALVLAALQETALAYVRRDADAIAFWRLATRPLAELEARATSLAAATGWEACQTAAAPGGGSLPGVEIASFGLCAPGDHRGALRANEPPVIARAEGGRTICDLRAVAPEDDRLLETALACAWAPAR